VRTPFASSAFMIDGFYGDATLFLNKARLIACAVAIITAVSLYLILEFTTLGKSLRAAADNPTAATYMGIDVDRAYRIAFALGCGITAVAGGLMATYLSFGPFIGLDYVIIMYSGVVLGGMGSILGAFWGGLTVGFVQQCSALILPPQLQNAAIFVVFLMIVLLRPQGLFGRSAERA
jgi:branched-chain amino acid transport system permease protein